MHSFLLKLLKERDEEKKIAQPVKFTDQNAFRRAVGTISLEVMGSDIGPVIFGATKNQFLHR
jgi:hypothetical protein